MGNTPSDTAPARGVDEEFVNEAVANGFSKEQAVQYVRLYNAMYAGGNTTFEVIS